MAHTFYFGNVKKRINSTLQGGTSAAYDVLFKNPTSLDTPTITLKHSGDFNYNYARYKDYYYFVTDKKSLANEMWEVTMELDPMATAKSDILSSIQYVCYSNISGGQWLADTRLITARNAITSAIMSASLDFPSTTGCYIISVLGQTGVDCFRISRSNMQKLIENLQTWQDDASQAINDTIDAVQSGEVFDALKAVGTGLVNTGFIGNKYEVAVQCIRSAHWIPFNSTIVGGTSHEIYLGSYPTGIDGYKINTSFSSGNVGISIPWHFSDYRRATNESVYLYLPFVGQTQISVDDCINDNGIVVKWSVTPSDGQICYEVQAGGKVIGTYGANCAMSIPIGINQQASLGEIATSIFNGISKSVGAATGAAGSLISGDVGGAVTRGVEHRVSQIETVYNTINTALSTTPVSIGGIGGGAGAGLDLSAKCFTVAHPTVIEPLAMGATMGVPTMKPLQLSNCSGYCQCANAHVSTDLDAPWIAKIDAYLNNGFYIE